MEYWEDQRMEAWNYGIMESWQNPTGPAKSVFLLYQYSDTPILHFSNTPVLQITEGVTHD
jgi:hypothetical protein